MVGRTPEYLGKKIARREIKLVVAVHPDHAGARAGRHRRRDGACPARSASILNAGPHGLSEVLYAFTSAGNNNGSAFAGLNANTAVLQHRARAGDARSAGSCRSCFVLGAGRLAGRPAAGARRPPARCPPTGRCSSGMLVGVVAHRRRPDLLPGARARPLAEGLS